MLKFEAFNLPTDGMTRVAELESYSNNLTNEGWSLVGLCESTRKEEDGPKLFGVYRMSESDAIKSAALKLTESEKKLKAAETKSYELDRQLKEMTARAVKAEAAVRDDEAMQALLRRARERFGKAFEEIEGAL